MKRTPLCFLMAAIATACAVLAPVSAQENGDQDHSIEIVILGDTSFGESYQDRLASQGREPVLRTRGYDHMIGNFAAILSDADFTVANLETAVTDKFPSPFAGDKRYLHYADVEKTPMHLAKYGIDLVSLANNHALDFGMAGLRQTLELLSARKIDSCGAGSNLAAAKRPYVKRFDMAGQNVHIAFLCMFEYRESYDRKYDFYSDHGGGGTNALLTGEIGSIVDELRRNYTNLFVIAYPHWGKNYRWATESQRAKARAMIEGGVDLVIGHGAHLVQEIDRYKVRWIVYSLGNFVFGSPGRYKKSKMHPYGAIATLVLSPSVNGSAKTLRLHPIFTDNRITGYQSRFVTETEFQEIKTLLRTRSGMPEQFDTLVSSGADEYGSFLELSAQP